MCVCVCHLESASDQQCLLHQEDFVRQKAIQRVRLAQAEAAAELAAHVRQTAWCVSHRNTRGRYFRETYVMVPAMSVCVFLCLSQGGAASAAPEEPLLQPEQRPADLSADERPPEVFGAVRMTL